MDNINVNDTVSVQLTPYGYILLRQNYEKLWAGRVPPYEFKLPKEDKDGWSRWQLWALMAEFGEYMRLGETVPFDTNIRLK